MNAYQIASILRDPSLHLQGSKLNALANRFADVLSNEDELPNDDRILFKNECGVDNFYIDGETS
jgi:hypothetical protein